jgi:hypothetical protein
MRPRDPSGNRWAITSARLTSTREPSFNRSSRRKRAGRRPSLAAAAEQLGRFWHAQELRLPRIPVEPLEHERGSFSDRLDDRLGQLEAELGHEALRSRQRRLRSAAERPGRSPLLRSDGIRPRCLDRTRTGRLASSTSTDGPSTTACIPSPIRDAMSMSPARATASGRPLKIAAAASTVQRDSGADTPRRRRGLHANRPRGRARDHP